MFSLSIRKLFFCYTSVQRQVLPLGSASGPFGLYITVKKKLAHVKIILFCYIVLFIRSVFDYCNKYRRKFGDRHRVGGFDLLICHKLFSSFSTCRNHQTIQFVIVGVIFILADDLKDKVSNIFA